MNKTLTALIVDDEQLAREEMKELLNEYKSIEVIGEADNVDSALIAIKNLQPDVVFLDVQMPIKTGFDLVNELESDTEIVFVTAYDQYAIRAFEVNAIDYLMKPIYPERLRQTIERLHQNPTIEPEVEEKLQNEDYIFFQMKNRSKFIKVDTIICITASKEYTEIVTTEGVKGLIYKSMIEWEKRLPEKNFIRIHRSSIINLKYVQELKASLNNTYKVFMKGISDPLVMSRRYAVKLKKTFL